MTMRQRLARPLRVLADRIDPNATSRRVGGEKPWGFHTCRIDGHQGCTPYECRWAPVEPARETR